MIPSGEPRLPVAVKNARLLRLLAGISTNLVSCPPDQVDEAIRGALQMVVETLDLDRSTIWQLGDDRAGMVLTHFWQKPGWPPLPARLDAAGLLPWCHAKILRGESFHFSTVGNLPPEARVDAENFLARGTRANVTAPLFADGGVFGAIGFAIVAGPREWTSDEIDGFELISRIIGNVIGRQRAELRAEQLRRELTRASRASLLGEIAAALAHEINQPLAAILGNAQAARRFIAAGAIDTAELLAILDDIIRDDKRAGLVIGNLRNMLEGSAAVREACCLNELVAEVCGFIEGGLATENIRLQRPATSQCIPVRAARLEIHEVLLNLILNASQAMAETPSDRRNVIIDTSIRDGEVVVEVADRGSGFPADQLARLFEPFHSTKPNGLGIGLAICKRIIEAHGGTISARNLEAGGAVFSFTLPVHGSCGTV